MHTHTHKKLFIVNHVPSQLWPWVNKFCSIFMLLITVGIFSKIGFTLCKTYSFLSNFFTKHGKAKLRLQLSILEFVKQTHVIVKKITVSVFYFVISENQSMKYQCFPEIPI